MPIFIRPASTYKLGRRMWVKVAGVWRSVLFAYRRNAASFIPNSNYRSGLEVSAFTSNGSVGDLNGTTTYSMSGESSPEWTASGKSCLVQKDAFFSSVSATYASNNFRNITCRAAAHGADIFAVPSSVTVYLYNGAGNSIGNVTLPLVQNDGFNARWELTGAAAAAIVDAIRYDTYQNSTLTRRIGVFF